MSRVQLKYEEVLVQVEDGTHPIFNKPERFYGKALCIRELATNKQYILGYILTTPELQDMARLREEYPTLAAVTINSSELIRKFGGVDTHRAL